MSTFSLQTTYRKDKPLAAYIYPAHWPEAKGARTEQVGPEPPIDCAGDGSSLGIEVISPEFVTEEEFNAVFERLGLEPPRSDELAPLRAA